jgi:hypothetical protein
VIARAIAALLICAAGAASAQDQPTDLTDFMGAHGCTIGADSRAAAVRAGFDEAAIDALAETAIAAQDAYQSGSYIVLERQICTIRLPEIASRFTVTSPEIVAMTSAIDAFADDGAPGCFLADAPAAFDAMNGGERGAGTKDYLAFVAAAIIAGDARYFGIDPLKTPVGFQVVSGTCGEVPDIAAIRANHIVMEGQFGEYVRQLGERTVCSDGYSGPWGTALSDLLQGADATYPYDPQPDHYNYWMWLEYYMIVSAAGWYEGMTQTDRGTPRPPLCHYP